MSVDSSGLIPNEAGPKDNPRELEYYEYQTQFTDPPDFCEHIEWIISGDVPKGISIDSGSGKISGVIEAFYDQPSASDNHPYEECNYDGSNWDKDGRLIAHFFDFHFSIIRNIMVFGPSDSCDDKKPFSESNTVYIKEVKCQNTNNLLFIKRYLESTKTSSLGNETAIHVDGVVYKDDYKKLQPNHQGPFTCPPTC